MPRRGEILDAGCGHGLLSLYLAAQSPERRITGVDIDDEKLAVARRAAAAAHVDDRVTLRARRARLAPGRARGTRSSRSTCSTSSVASGRPTGCTRPRRRSSRAAASW